jgi:ABC-type polysaccharide/polyol phosphate transport system ATPase subunit
MSPPPAPAPTIDGPIAIQAEGLKKAFRIPIQRVDSLKERVVHPFAAREYRELRALDDVSFEVRQGEFFGIVGRNGSGKSTLLKILASIYRVDAGSIKIAGRLAPFIELGVGFNHDLTARENVVLNGVMMGLTPRETRGRLDAVLEFAELGEFVDLKLKNYSSGMLVRLAFSVMMQADADVLLIDEVLAVGDAAFQQKCTDAFHQMKGAGKTIVLVTHEMEAVEAYCHRAMLIDSGKIQHIGDPAEIGREYLKLNFETGGGEGGGIAGGEAEGARLLDCWIENDEGERATTLERGEQIRLRAELEVLREASGLGVGFIIGNADGLGLFEFGTTVKATDGSEDLAAGERVTVKAELDNPLAPGRHFVHCGVQSHRSGDVSIYVPNALNFVVFGGQGQGSRGILSLRHEIEAVVEETGTA